MKIKLNTFKMNLFIACSLFLFLQLLHWMQHKSCRKKWMGNKQCDMSGKKRGVKKLHCKIFAIKIFHCIKLISQSHSRVCMPFFWMSTFLCMPFENAALIIHIWILHQTMYIATLLTWVIFLSKFHQKMHFIL